MAVAAFAFGIPAASWPAAPDPAPPASPVGAPAAHSTGKTGKAAVALPGDLLHTPVALDAAGQPLAGVLAGVSKRAPVDLLVSRAIGEQRVTLESAAAPISELMRRLQELLSHSSHHPEGYYWQKLERKAGEKPGYLLWRTEGSVQRERAMLDYPRVRAAQILRQFRDAMNAPDSHRHPEQYGFNDDWISDPDLQPFRDAFRGLSDEQIGELVAGDPLPLNRTTFASQISLYNTQWHGAMEQGRAEAIAAGAPDPFPSGVPAAPQEAPSLVVKERDEDGQSAAQSTSFNIHLRGAALAPQGEIAIYLRPLDDRVLPFLDPETSGGPVYDLSPLLRAKGVTPWQRGDMDFTLGALARVTGIAIYQEYFYKTDQNGQWPGGLQTLKGTLPELINAICDEWGYTAVRSGNDYLFWSRHWAQDRAADIAEPTLERWRAVVARQGFLSFDNRMELASSLSWPQQALTLSVVIPEAALPNRVSYSALRYLGRLGPDERAAALSDAGLPLATLNPWQQQELLEDFQGELSNATAEDLNRARLTVQMDPGGPVNGRTRVRVEIASGTADLMGCVLSFPDQKPPPIPLTAAATPGTSPAAVH